MPLTPDDKPIVLAETKRTYLFTGRNVEVDAPRELRISTSGNHRIRTQSGELVIVSPNWLAIRIEDESGEWTV